MKSEIQDCDKYQPCRIYIKNTLVVEVTMSSVKAQAAIFKSEFGVNQHDKVLRKKQSLGLRLKNLFPNEDIIEEYLASHYRTNFTFKKHMLVVEIGEKQHVGRDPDCKRKIQKELEKLDYRLIRIDPDKIDFIDYKEFGRLSAYIADPIKKQTEKSTKKLLIHNLSKRLLELEFK